MQEKHVQIRIEQCLALAKASNCPRRRFGALLVDPSRNVVLMDGSIRSISENISLAVWRALGTRAGRESIDSGSF